MDRMAAALERFGAWVDKITIGMGDMILNVFGMIVVLVLFYFLVPRNFRQILTWSTGMGCVFYFAEWLVRVTGK